MKRRRVGSSKSCGIRMIKFAVSSELTGAIAHVEKTFYLSLQIGLFAYDLYYIAFDKT